MVVTLTLNPSVDRTLVVPEFGHRDRGVLSVRSVTRRPGGKGVNVSLCLRELGVGGVAVVLVGRGEESVYRDAFCEGPTRIETVAAEGVTRSNTTILNPDTGAEVHLVEPGFAVGPEDRRRFSQALAVALSPVRLREGEGRPWLVLGGSLPPGLETEDVAVLLESHAESTQLVLDARPSLLAGLLRLHPALIKPNRGELGALTGRDTGSVMQAAAAAEDVLRMGAEAVLCSLGAEGAILVREGLALHCRSVPVEVQSTVGAGDACLAGYLWRAAEGDSEALRAAVACGAAACEQSGAGRLDATRVNELLDVLTVVPI